MNFTDIYNRTIEARGIEVTHTSFKKFDRLFSDVIIVKYHSGNSIFYYVFKSRYNHYPEGIKTKAEIESMLRYMNRIICRYMIIDDSILDRHSLLMCRAAVIRHMEESLGMRPKGVVD